MGAEVSLGVARVVVVLFFVFFFFMRGLWGWPVALFNILALPFRWRAAGRRWMRWTRRASRTLSRRSATHGAASRSAGRFPLRVTRVLLRAAEQLV